MLYAHVVTCNIFNSACKQDVMPFRQGCPITNYQFSQKYGYAHKKTQKGNTLVTGISTTIYNRLV